MFLALSVEGLGMQTHLKVHRTVPTTRSYEVQEATGADGEEPCPEDTKSIQLLLIHRQLGREIEIGR